MNKLNEIPVDSRQDEYENMTEDDFSRILRELVNQSPASYLFDILGVYELVAEDYHNIVLEYWEQENEQKRNNI